MKDMLGNEVVLGDFFAYAMRKVNSGVMVLYKFKEHIEGKGTKAWPIKRRDSAWKPMKWDKVTQKYRELNAAEKAKEREKTSTLLDFRSNAIKIDISCIPSIYLEN